jgi:hypothetical protein
MSHPDFRPFDHAVVATVLGHIGLASSCENAAFLSRQPL